MAAAIVPIRMPQPITQRNNINTTKNNSSSSSGSSRAFRKRWIPAAKTILSSLVDIVGDWVFYNRSRVDLKLDEYEELLLTFCIISSIFGFLTVVSIFTKKKLSSSASTGAGNKAIPPSSNALWITQQGWGKWLLATNHLLACEMFLEDIPQFVLTALVTSKKSGGVLSPVAVFNITTSGTNFAFNILDIFMPEDEEIEPDNDQDDDAFHDDTVA